MRNTKYTSIFPEKLKVFTNSFIQMKFRVYPHRYRVSRFKRDETVKPRKTEPPETIKPKRTVIAMVEMNRTEVNPSGRGCHGPLRQNNLVWIFRLFGASIQVFFLDQARIVLYVVWKKLGTKFILVFSLCEQLTETSGKPEPKKSDYLITFKFWIASIQA